MLVCFCFPVRVCVPGMSAYVSLTSVFVIMCKPASIYASDVHHRSMQLLLHVEIIYANAGQMCMSMCMYAGNKDAISMLHLISQALKNSPAAAQLPSMRGRFPAA